MQTRRDKDKYLEPLACSVIFAATQPLFLRSGPPCRAGSGPEIRGKVDPNWQGTPGQFPHFMGSRLLPPTFDSNEIPRKQK